MKKLSPVLMRSLAVAFAVLLIASTVLVWRATRQPDSVSGNPAPASQAATSSATVDAPRQSASSEASASAASKKATGANALTPNGGATAPPAGRDQATSGGGPEDRYANNVVLSERETPIVIGGERRIKRLRLVRDETFKYPLVRVEDEFRDDPAGRVLLRQTAMVGDHVMVKLKDPKMDEATLLAQLNHPGATVRRKMPASGVWLVTFPDVDLDAVPTMMAALARLDGLVRYAEPDYIAHTMANPNDSSFASLWGMNNVGQVAGSICKVQVELMTIGGTPLTRSPSTPGVVGTLHNCGLGSPGEFPWQVAGNIALIQRGTLTFAAKVTNAMAAGATAVIIYNNVAGEFLGDLGTAGPWVPAMGISQANGAALLGYLGDKTARVTIGGTSTVDADIDAPEAWELSTGSTAVKVGVIDSGIDLTHPDLAANLWVNPAEIPGNGIDDDGNGYIDDTSGWDFVNNDNLPVDDNFHGTHCAGTIGGVGNNGAGVAGVCWTVSLIPLKNSNSSGASATSDSQEAVAYATAIGVDLTSNSYGGGPFTQSEKDAIDAANAAGILFVASAGNNNQNTDDLPFYPAGYDSPNVIAVAATTSSETRSSFSNYGLTTVDLGAPGTNIFSTFPTVMTSAMAASGYSTNYQSISGTSMAAPHVAGACALLKSFRPSLTHLEIKNAILSSVDVIPAMTGITVTGGRLNVHAALVSLDDLTVSPIGSLVAAGPVGGPFTPSSQIHTLTNTGTTSAISWTASASEPWMSVSPAGGILAPGSSTTVTMTFNSAASSLAVGPYGGLVTFSDVTNAKVLSRSVTLSAEGPEIVVEQPAATGLGDGVGSQDFATVSVGGNASRTFTIRNVGAGSLTGLSVSKSGPHSADFTVGSLGATTLAFDASTTFTVTFAPGAAGTRNAAIHIASNDSDENPFDIELNGTGLTPGVFTNFQDASAIIGQTNFTAQLSTARQNVTPSPGGCAISATGKLAVCEQGSRRVLIWNSIPTSSGVPADVVVGKANFTDTTAGVSASLTGVCNGVAFSPDGQKLLVSDSANHRVLIWNTVPTTSGVPADVVIGQTDFTTGTSGLSATKFNVPTGLHVTQSGRLLVADAFNNRVLIFNSIPTSNGAAANVVVGQATMTTKVAGASASEMNLPFGLAVTVDGRLLVAEEGNNRVLVFGSVPATNGASASVVIGQSAFGLSGAGTSATTMRVPIGVALSPTGALAVSDSSNNRVLIFNSVPATNGAAADAVLGQPDFVSTMPFNGGVSARSMATPFGLVFAPDGRLLVPGRDMKRVMVFGSPVPEMAVEQPAGTGLTDSVGSRSFGSVAVGGSAVLTFTVRNAGALPLTGLSVTKDGPNQADFGVGPLATTLAPSESTTFTVTFAPGAPGVRTAAIHIASNDADENPFDIALNGSGAFTNFQDASVIIGQANSTDQLSTTNQSVTPGPSGCAISATGKLAVCDQQAARVLIWNSIPTRSGVPADVVLGKANFTDTALGPSASQTKACNGVAFSPDGQKLLVADSGYHRVLIWNTVPTTNGVPADVVIGQPDFTTVTSGLSAAKFNYPSGLAITQSGRLIVADDLNNRVLIFNSIPTSNGAVADVVVGQSTLTTNAAGNAANAMNGPFGVAVTADGRLLVAETGNDRVTVFGSVPTTHGASASVVIGQSAFGVIGNNGTSATIMNYPIGVGVSPTGALAVADFFNDRVLLFNSVPTTNGAAADAVLGQPDFVTDIPFNGGVSARSMTNPFGPVFAPDGRLLVPGRDMNRVMVFGFLSAWQIAVEQPAGTGLVDGTDTRDFGQVSWGGNANRTFTIRNDGGVSLTGLSVSKDGANSADFTAGPLGATTLAPGASTTFTVTFSPGAAGTRNAVIRIAGNETSENPFDIALTGTGVIPDIAVEQPEGTDLVDGVSTVAFDNVIAGAVLEKRFAIRNEGTGTLTLASASIDGADASDFSVAAFSDTTLLAGETGYLNVSFSPTVLNARAAVLHIVSNDPDESPFDIALTGSGTAAAGPILLARDINRVAASFSPGLPLVIGGVAYFQGTTASGGTELWRTDGTAAGTFMVRDILVGTGSGGAGNLTNVNGTLFFTSVASGTGTELFKSDGTNVGTVMVKDIAPGSASSSPAGLTAVGSTLFFAATVTGSGTELWKSDGTSAGTVQVADIAPGTAGSSPAELCNVNGTLFFTANNGVTGVELWKSDGTPAGTVPVADIAPGTASSSPTNLTALGSALIFTVNDGVNGTELWSSDGTTTALLKDINPGTASSSPTNFVRMGSVLYFSASTSTEGRELWKTDGTTAGTVLVSDIVPGANSSSPSSLVVVGSTIYFSAFTSANGIEPWKSDGTAAGTVLLRDIAPGNIYSSPLLFTEASGIVYFVAGISNDKELWRTDGTTLGTVLVKDINPGAAGSSLTNFANVAGTLIFSADDGLRGTELWKSDGTPAGTVPLLEEPGSNSASVANLWAVDGTVFFSASDAINGTELWKSDGTVAGTVMVSNIAGGLTSSNPANLTNIGSTLYFTAFDSANGTELRKSDGTGAGTVLVANLANSSSSSSPASLTPVGSTLYFSANDGTNGAELWKSDGTSAGTTLVRNINATASTGSSLANLTNFNGTLFFSANDGVNGQELWKSDGTPGGTELVKDINAGTASSSPGNLRVVGSKLFFTATTAENGTELWMTDGTTLGTVPVADIEPGTGSSFPANLTVMGSTLFFSANNGASVNGTELWKSDGTSTVLVKDINLGTGSSSPTALASVDGTLYFSAFEATNGRELWKSDGTEAGTVLVSNVNPGAASSSPTTITNVHGLAFMNASTAAAGAELWLSNGTEAGTTQVADLFAGTTSSSPSRLTVAGNLLFFTARGPDLGLLELFVIDVTPFPEIVLEEPVGTGLADGLGTTSFGQLAVGANAVRTYIVRNVGNASLTGLSTSKDGANSADFTLGSLGATTLAPGASTTFTVSFAPGALGVRDAALHIASNDADENPFDVALTGTGLTRLEGWRVTHFGSPANSGDGASANDFEFDGMSNFLEFSMNTHPKQASQPPQSLVRNGANLEFTYTRAKAAVLDGVVFAVKWTDTLTPASWSSAGVSESILSDNGTVQQVKATLPAGAGSRRFIRLEVTGN